MMSVLGTVVRFLSSLSLLSWPFLGVFESESVCVCVRVCVCVCVLGVILPIMHCAEVLWGIGLQEPLLISRLAGCKRLFLLGNEKKRGQEAKQTRKEK